MERKLRNAVRTVSITTSTYFRQRILIKKAWPAQAQSAKLRLIIGWSETASWTVQAEAGPEW